MAERAAGQPGWKRVVCRDGVGGQNERRAMRLTSAFHMQAHRNVWTDWNPVTATWWNMVESSDCYRLESSDCCCTAELAYSEYCKEKLGESVPGRSLRKGGEGLRAGVCVYTMGDYVFVVASVVNEGLSPCRAWCLYHV